jgi:hypothetical protein
MINLIAIETAAHENFYTMDDESENRKYATQGDWSRRDGVKTPSTVQGINAKGSERLISKSPLEQKPNKVRLA